MVTIFHRFLILIILLFIQNIYSQSTAKSIAVREKIAIDHNWRFAFGHLYDTDKDFNHATGYFSYLAKAGNGDGAAAPDFDDRAWRLLNIPHDWAVEQPFDENGSFSHGFKAAGKGYPEKSIGWYRKKIDIPESDLGRIITLQFDGVFRNSKVWFNGHFLGTEESGYNSFEYDVTDYINYGGKNTIAVRVDASMEEGWFYEGAGIYRHVWLKKTEPLHVATNGTYVTTDIEDDFANVTAQVTIENKGSKKGEVEIVQTIFNQKGEQVAKTSQKAQAPDFYGTTTVNSTLKVNNPQLWDIDSPNLYKLVTEIKRNNNLIDQYTTKFGIRSFYFDAEKGFFLNGKHVKLKGTNNHQDHAGVGAAMPDELQYFRISKLKEMGSNAYRCSHNPPTPELLEACDSLGMLVIDEARLMGINKMHLDNLRKMIERDRNHPSIICWSVGNEEWKIEGGIVGERITLTLQDYVKTIDSTRPVSVGISSGFKSGISSVVEVMGYNYLGNGDIDAHRNEYKEQPGMGSEEGSTFATRGVYFTDDEKHYKSAYDVKPRPSFYSIEEGWNFYADREYLAGMFIWTGFDYRGEPTPYGWPSVTSYFGMMDVCGFPKDNVYYLKSWWGTEPVVHVFPHWNWEGKEGEEIPVWVYSNCEELELFLNNKSLGKKKMKQNSHLEWQVTYKKGEIKAVGYNNGKKVLTDVQKTTGNPEKIALIAHKKQLTGSDDIAVITVETLDKKDLHVPTANNEITFSVNGGGKIIGVGNGNPTSLEKDKFLDDITTIAFTQLQEQALASEVLPETLSEYNESDWKEAFKDRDYKNLAPSYIYKTTFKLDELSKKDKITFFYEKIGEETAVFVNGHLIAPSQEDSQKYVLNNGVLKQGINTLHIIATPIHKVNDWAVINSSPGIIQVITPSESWKRKLFNGYAQVIVQTDGSDNEITVTATAKDLKSDTIVIKK
ncbi:beta-galactosidase [Flavobacterium suaedae]|uniref:Beta-galactosidase n=1 Tax=Flavobacterium suaedae TaxID=1767027 RepID=A0ABQ1JCW9_9FLAO|nr:beta-galactosidase GalA [Flavobacterium suaedae]GGB64177.1 beta-galactosidase [Flavobacterium suaedae]